MATLIAYQDGNFTGATTFKTTATGTGSSQLAWDNNQAIPSGTTYTNSTAFTLTNGEIIEGVILPLYRQGATASGTLTVGLSADNGVTYAREVVLNAADITTTYVAATGVNFAFVFVKFDTPLTADGGNDYRLGLKTSVGSQLFCMRDGTSGNWGRIFRTSTTATVATTDIVYISDELTGQGTSNDITVTMNETATTSYGAMNIGQGGTVSYGTSASTNYYLRLAGNLRVGGGGTLSIGTSTTRIPSTSTATLEFNCSSNVQFGLEAFNSSTVNIYGAEKASTKVLLTADAASGQAVITVQSTTGWAANDEVGIGATGTNYAHSERRTISSIGSSTQATLTTNLSQAHSGTSPFQGEVINLTRNVKIRGTSSTLQSYVNCAATSSFTADNAEFFFLGSATANKRGINSATTSAGVFVMTGCSMYDFLVAGSTSLFSSSASGNWELQNCTIFQSAVGPAIETSTATTGTPTINGNWILASGNAITINLLDAGITFTNNRVVGANYPVRIAENNLLGTFSDNVIHSGSGVAGLGLSGVTGGTITNLTVWRNIVGFQGNNVILDGFNARNNGTSNAVIFSDCKVINSVFNGGATQHIDLRGSDVVFENCDFGQTTVATNFLTMGAVGADATFINCDIAESLTPLNQTNLFSPTSTPVIGLDKLNSTSGNHRAYKQFGYAGSDQSVYRTASPSEVLVPNSASGKLPSGSKKFGVASGNDATVSVWVRKSSTYNGAEPRLILKRNIVGGVSSDQVLDTASGATETWLELTASTPTVTDDCVLEVYVDCDGTAGTVNVDDYSIS